MTLAVAHYRFLAFDYTCKFIGITPSFIGVTPLARGVDCAIVARRGAIVT